ncbi:MAG TPA: hypothetical protein VGR70_20160 [Stellaceae bacterium]|nr:hypothetical protein [Stellaceae bacterium]
MPRVTRIAPEFPVADVVKAAELYCDALEARDLDGYVPCLGENVPPTGDG